MLLQQLMKKKSEKWILKIFQASIYSVWFMQDTSSKGMYSLADLQSKLNTNKDVHGMYKKIEEQSTIKVKKNQLYF